jgi:hypothetical protein
MLHNYLSSYYMIVLLPCRTYPLTIISTFIFLQDEQQSATENVLRSPLKRLYISNTHTYIYISNISTLKIRNYVSYRLKPEPRRSKNVKITEVHFIFTVSAYTMLTLLPLHLFYSHKTFNSHYYIEFFSGGLTRTRHLLLIMSYSMLHYP